MEFAKQHTGSAYAPHIANCQRVMGNHVLIPPFNQKLRLAFVSVIEAGVKQAEQEFLQSAEPAYAQVVRTAWETVGASAQVNAVHVSEHIQEARKAKKAVKRRRTDADATFDALYQSSLEVDECTTAVPVKRSSRKRRKAVGGRRKKAEPSAQADETVLLLPSADDLLQRAVNAPLPDADDELMLD